MRERKHSQVGRYHLLLGRDLDLDQVEAEAEADAAPGHVWCRLRRRLNMAVHAPKANSASHSLMADRLRSKLCSTPALWALARQVVAQAGANDVLYCTGEDVGLPVAAMLNDQPNERPRLVLCAHNLDRPRARLALKRYRAAERVDKWLVFSQYQSEFIQRFLDVPADRVRWVPERTEPEFFTPGPSSPDKSRPMIASFGLEQRDYRTLAAACAPLDVDVRFSGFSADTPRSRRHYPRTLPANMTRRFYPWPELRQLYRDADVIVVSLFPCTYCAGITTLLEAWACRRPVIITHTLGLREFTEQPHGCRVVPTGDPAAMREAIRELLDDPNEAQRLAEQGYQRVWAEHTPERWLKQMVGELESVNPPYRVQL